MTNKPIILCVDDEKFILDTLLAQLRRKFGDSYEYELAESGEEALQLIKDLAENNQEVRLVISDQIMPGMKGNELLTYINEQNKETVKILLTGQASLESAVNAINDADLFRYMTKPWAEDDLLLTVGQGLEKYALKSEMLDQIKIFSHFVPKQFLDALSIKSILNVKLGESVERQMSVMFFDIRNFTTKSEAMSPKENFDFVNSYLSYVEHNITRQKGFIDKFIGDAVMALFYTEQEALQASIEIFTSLKKFNIDFSNMPFSPVTIGVGLHTGSLMLGIVGVPSRLQTSVFSDSVNISARLETLTKYYGSEIIVSRDFYEALGNSKDLYKFRFLGSTLLRGKIEPLSIFEVLDPSFGPISVLKIQTQADFEEGVEHYIKARFAESCLSFKKVLDINPEDKAAKHYLEYGSKLITQPLPENWKGVLEGAFY